MSPLKCEQAAPLLDEFVLGTLDAAQAAAVQEHLNNCHACSDSLALTTSLFSDLDGLAEDVVPLPTGLGGDLADRLLARLPRLPGDADPLAGLKVPRPGRRLAATVLGLSAVVMEGIWLLAVWLLPVWLVQSIRLLASTFWQGAVAILSSALYALELTVGIVIDLVVKTDPELLVAVALVAAAGAFVFAISSPHNRWDS